MTRGLQLVVWFAVMLEVWGTSMAAGQEGQKHAGRLRVVLVGASIGQEWRLAEFPARVAMNDVEFESIAVWRFDKSNTLDEVLMRPKRKFHLSRSYLAGMFGPAPQPADIIILKECSSYFPGDVDRYKSMIIEWIRQVRTAGKQVIVTTVAPVTRARAATDKGKMEAIREFNDWIRGYAKISKVLLLDLERTLADGSTDRFLRDDLTIGDGSHLNKQAYTLLDQLLKAKLSELVSSSKSRHAS